MTEGNELTLAQEEAQTARRELTAALIAIQSRLTPRALAREAIDEIRETGAELAQAAIVAAKRNPAPLIGIGVTLIALLARYWFVHAFGSTAAPTRSTPTRTASHPSEGTSDD